MILCITANVHRGDTNGMSNSSAQTTAPEDRIPFLQKVIYGLGGFVNNLLGAAIGGMVAVLNIGLGMNPALVGLVAALPRIMDAFTDPMMGYISDNTQSRWGRRRPYIFIGAIVVAIVFALLWQLPRGVSESYLFWYFLGGSLIFYLAYTMFATPWVALGYELTPDYNERTRLMGVQNFFAQLAFVVSPWFLAIMQWDMFDDMVDGAEGLGYIIAILVVLVGVLPAIFLRERLSNDVAIDCPVDEDEAKESLGAALIRNLRCFFAGFLTTLKFKPYLKLCAATFLVFNGFMLIASFQLYVFIYYVFGGDTEAGSNYFGIAGTVQTVSSFAIIVLITFMATRFGKRKTLMAAIAISMIGYALKWVCYNPEIPWLVIVPAPFMAFGLGALFTLMPSMIADVVDADELNTQERREGMYGSIFWWVVKLGMAAALAAGGFLLNATGFDVALAGAQSQETLTMMRIFDAFIPVATSALAIWAILSFSITEERARAIREELERRRGTMDALPA